MSNLPLPWTEKMKLLPEMFGIRLNEEPIYRVVKSDGAFEVRRYGELILASLTLENVNFDEFRNQAFPRLANYLFGQNRGKISMAMTSPVLHYNSGLQKWTMSFVMPSKYSLRNAPKPKDHDIRLEVMTPFEAVVVTFTGNNTLENIERHEQELTHWLAFKNDLKPEGKYLFAQYDGPFVIPFLKRNEVMVKLLSIH